MCKVLQVSRSGYYSWKNRVPSKRKLYRMELIKRIQWLFTHYKKRYGSPRIWQCLQKEGYKICRQTVRNMMQQLGLYARKKKKYRVTTDSSHGYKTAPNILNRKFNASIPGKVWVSDITYIPGFRKWKYLTMVMDIFDRKIIGWNLSNTLETAQTVEPALNKALNNRKPSESLLFHSDRGIQYVANQTKTILKKHKIIQSMSRKGNCWDNAVAESFFKTLKQEWLPDFKIQKHKNLGASLFEYIEIFYNRQRIHSSLGYKTPLEIEQNYYKHNN